MNDLDAALLEAKGHHVYFGTRESVYMLADGSICLVTFTDLTDTSGGEGELEPCRYDLWSILLATRPKSRQITRQLSDGSFARLTYVQNDERALCNAAN